MKIVPTPIFWYLHRIIEEELTNRNEVIDFNKINEQNKNIIWFKHHDLEVRILPHPNNPEIANFWTISQGVGTVFHYKSSKNYYSVSKVKQATKRWVENYTQKRKEIFQKNSLPTEDVENTFLCLHHTFTILCLVSPNIKNQVYWSIFDKNNDCIISSWVKCSSVTEGQYAGYAWIYKNRPNSEQLTLANESTD
jgi:hypothetical protein